MLPNAVDLQWILTVLKMISKNARRQAARQAEREGNLARVRLVENAMGPYERTRPRDPAKAQALRSIGTPAQFIGPVSAGDHGFGDDDEQGDDQGGRAGS